jgi:cobalt-zinc-cadmium efflux system membrane fusion protein
VTNEPNTHLLLRIFTMRLTSFIAALGLATAAFLSPPAHAGEGHDHGEAAPAAAGPALPRFAAASETFELVGVLNGKQITLYLDRAADNSPVTDAQIEIEIAGTKLKAEKHEDAYEVVLAAEPKPGVLPVTATVTAGTETDLLAGEFDLHEEVHADESAHAHGWQEYAGWAAGAIAALAVLIVVVRRVAANRQLPRRSPRMKPNRIRTFSALAATPLAALMLILAGARPVHAGEGHDHGGAAAAPSANGPQRLPDGGVFLPKPAQRQLGIRTLLTEAAELPRSFELNGKVVMDPNAGGKVQPLNAGRVEPGPRGLPTAGQTVRKGEVLAYVVPSAAPIERSNQAAQLAELRAAKALADKRVARLKELSDTVPRKDIEAAESEALSLAERIAAVGTGLATREALVAPVSGVIASTHVVAGQVVDARELVFEVVDPQRLHIEAVTFDPAVAAGIGRATLAVGNERVPLAFVGAARSLREQALPLTFRAQGKALSALAVGQPVRVFVQGKELVKGIAVPVASLMKNPANQTIVWVKTAPERFEPRTVTTEPLDGVNVAVTSG